MAEKFPEVRKTVDLLSGLIDPRRFYPYTQIPIELSIIDEPGVAALAQHKGFDVTNPRRVIATNQQGSTFYTPFTAKSGPVKLYLSDDILTNSIKFPIIVKEISQHIDFLDYCRIYVSYLKQIGLDFKIDNPLKTPTTEEEMMIAIANNPNLETYLTGKARFKILIDNGSFLRTGVIFANWHQDQIAQGFEPTGKLVDVGLYAVNFLKSKGLIREKGGLIVWSSGQAPQINNPGFLELASGFTPRG